MRFGRRQAKASPESDAESATASPAERAGGTEPATPTAPAAPAAPLDAEEIALLRASVALVGPLAGDLTVYFYAILFQRHPEVRQLFPANMDVQRDRLLRGLLRIVDLVDSPEQLVHFCSRLGRDHRKFGTLSGHYPAVGAALLDSLARFAGDAWTPRLADVWTRAYGVVAEVMIQAADQDATVHPAVWTADIVHHRLRGPGIAEITVRPHQPYPFRPGQYATVETPWQPRAWRYYSMANAPRPDGTLTFHVRAVRGGQVSPGLVFHARPGDQVTLGAAQGDMVLDSDHEGNVLCVAGGTGLAPIQALVEQTVQDGGRRFVDVFVGARTADELYGLDDMLRLAQRNHWLSVRGVLSDQQVPGWRGSLPEALHEFGPFYRHQVYLSGPSEMVAGSAEVLLRQGVPQQRLHYDPFDVPVLEAKLPRPS
ncbi:globin domain-containing protein [Streptacidiphilus fuscans]|uniref:nitric oxide dioxygenase n=1 Tax=Streptacidiphilus fuscans TaxID=2789292 RepID=A0A931B110_9ACTN|nr:globin domain-containing protein [Streptacidiphilus fuscans]MBF9066961.1 flavohemoprotein [Streptacidiphilus fuscans]